MTKETLQAELLAALDAAEAEARQAHATAQAAELRAAFVRGQLDMLARITIQPTVTHGSEDDHA